MSIGDFVEKSQTIPYDGLPEFLSPDEFRTYLRLSRNTVYELLRRGEIRHVRFGRTIRIPKSQLLSQQDHNGVYGAGRHPSTRFRGNQ